MTDDDDPDLMARVEEALAGADTALAWVEYPDPNGTWIDRLRLHALFDWWTAPRDEPEEDL